MNFQMKRLANVVLTLVLATGLASPNASAVVVNGVDYPQLPADTIVLPDVVVSASRTGYYCGNCDTSDGGRPGNSYAEYSDYAVINYQPRKVTGPPKPEDLPLRTSKDRPISHVAKTPGSLSASNILVPSSRWVTDMLANSGTFYGSQIQHTMRLYREKRARIAEYYNWFKGREKAGANSLPYPLSTQPVKRLRDKGVAKLLLASNPRDTSRVAIYSQLNRTAKKFNISGVAASFAATKLWDIKQEEYAKALTASEAALVFAHLHPAFEQANQVKIFNEADVPDLFYDLAETSQNQVPGLAAAAKIAIYGLRSTPVFYADDTAFERMSAAVDDDIPDDYVYATTVAINASDKPPHPYFTHAIIIKERHKDNLAMLLHEAFHAGVKLLEQAEMQHLLASKTIDLKKMSAPQGRTAAQHRAIAADHEYIVEALDSLTPAAFLREMQLTQGPRYFSSGEEFTNHLFLGVIPDYLADRGAIRVTGREADDLEFMSQNFVLGVSRESGLPITDSLFAPDSSVLFSLVSSWVFNDVESQSVLIAMEKAVAKERSISTSNGSKPREIKDRGENFVKHLARRIVKKVIERIYSKGDRT